jgi:hypothetical protein
MARVIVRTSRDWGGLRLDTFDWPIVLLDFPEHRLEEGALASALTQVEHLLREGEASGEKSFQITDMTRIQTMPGAPERKYAGEWMKRTAPLQLRASVGAANVTPSTIVRGIVTAVHWFQPPPTPTVFVATRREAMIAAMKRLEEAHIVVPSSVRIKVK